MTRIIGIVLVRNEERFVEQAISNICEFCDEIFLVDHLSSDMTPNILRKISKTLPNTRFFQISHPSESHALVQQYVNSPTWIFGVDGDELYEPDRLKQFRKRLLNGEFDRYWMILGNVLHCEELDLGTMRGRGYLAPPSRSMTKFYNFNAITSWDGYTPERLHGGQIMFKSGFDNGLRCYLHDQESWEDACFRCLHLCFINRSRIDASRSSVRQNILEIYGSSRWQEFKKQLLRMFQFKDSSDWKKQRYCRGECVTANISSFFSGDCHVRDASDSF